MSYKRYLLFGGSEYYPEGGMLDFISDHDTVEEALDAELKWSKNYGKESGADGVWSHIWDMELHRCVFPSSLINEMKEETDLHS